MVVWFLDWNRCMIYSSNLTLQRFTQQSSTTICTESSLIKQQLLTADVATSVSADLQDLLNSNQWQFPTYSDDLIGAMAALIRLQDTYNISTAEMVDNNIQGMINKLQKGSICVRHRLLPRGRARAWERWGGGGGRENYTYICAIFNNHSTRACWIWDGRLPTSPTVPRWQ